MPVNWLRQTIGGVLKGVNFVGNKVLKPVLSAVDKVPGLNLITSGLTPIVDTVTAATGNLEDRTLGVPEGQRRKGPSGAMIGEALLNAGLLASGGGLAASAAKGLAKKAGLSIAKKGVTKAAAKKAATNATSTSVKQTAKETVKDTAQDVATDTAINQVKNSKWSKAQKVLEAGTVAAALGAFDGINPEGEQMDTNEMEVDEEPEVQQPVQTSTRTTTKSTTNYNEIVSPGGEFENDTVQQVISPSGGRVQVGRQLPSSTRINSKYSNTAIPEEAPEMMEMDQQQVDDDDDGEMDTTDALLTAGAVGGAVYGGRALKRRYNDYRANRQQSQSQPSQPSGKRPRPSINALQPPPPEYAPPVPAKDGPPVPPKRRQLRVRTGASQVSRDPMNSSRVATMAYQMDSQKRKVDPNFGKPREIKLKTTPFTPFNDAGRVFMEQTKKAPELKTGPAIPMSTNAPAPPPPPGMNSKSNLAASTPAAPPPPPPPPQSSSSKPSTKTSTAKPTKTSKSTSIFKSLAMGRKGKYRRL